MASIIKAGNATDGVQVSSDATGALDIKTGTGAGTTAISIDASQNVTIPGTLTVGSGTGYALNAYVAPATWTKPAGLRAIKVTVVGAGGGGGAIAPSSPAAVSGGGGGGGGGAAIEFIPAPSIPGPVSVTAGPGTNSFGAFCSATAGGDGGDGGGAATTFYGSSGAGGVGSGGNLNINGGPGSFGSSAGPSISFGGGGGPRVAISPCVARVYVNTSLYQQKMKLVILCGLMYYKYLKLQKYEMM
jgi:hypothetical protein